VAQAPQSTQEANFLGRFASVVSLLGIAIFFAGWIYRWSYFYFFQLDITTLDLAPQSFLLVPLQVFLADRWTIGKTAIAFILTMFAIHINLWLIQAISEWLTDNLEKMLLYHTARRKNSWKDRFIKSLAEYSVFQLGRLKFLRLLINEIIVVSWVLVVIFWLAQSRGIMDARRDAGQNSTLPVVALVVPEDKLVLGRKLDDPFANTSLEGYRIIGDRGLFDYLWLKEDNDISDPQQPKIWRLLIERGGWIYLFKSLPPKVDQTVRPPVLAIQENYMSSHMMILSPEPSKK
jgi:hypothetical protein